MDEELRWVILESITGDYHDLRDAENRILGWVRPRGTAVYYWLACEGINPKECPCFTLEEAKAFVEAQYILTRNVS